MFYRHCLPRVTARALFLLAALVLAGRATAADLRTQREAFRKAYALAQQGGDSWRAEAGSLADYPLYPYLEAAALEHDLATLPPGRVEAYIKRYPHMIPARQLRRDYLLQAGKDKRWSDFRALYRAGLGDTLSCYALQARLADVKPLDFKHDLAPLWRKASLPDACDPVLRWAHDHHLLTRERLWSRLDTAATAGNANTVALLARWLHGHDATAARHTLLALRDPAQAADAAGHWPNTPRNRRAAVLALRRLARSDSSHARKAWSVLRRHFSLTHSQSLAVRTDIALFSATDFEPGAGRLLAALPRDAQTPATREWRVRVALARRDWKQALAAIHALPATLRGDEEWRYFEARALAALGHRTEADAAFRKLAGEANYFGFLSADRIDAPYAICPLQLDDPPADADALLRTPGLRRAFELFAVGLLPEARREWSHALRGVPANTRRLVAAEAFRRGWYDRAIFTFSSGDALRLYHMRFPLARQDHIRDQATDAGIDPAWAYAIARAESAWVSDARSHAGALGLMQLMPETARRVARKHHLPYAGAASLTDPQVNVALGTHYLADMAQRYDGAPWLASAAYNAGPAKLDEWLNQRGDLPPDLFVATIPYHETRDYVARVMAFSVIYDWRLNDRVVPLHQRMPRFGLPYAPPGKDAARKPVQCPASPPAAGTSP